MKKNYIHIFWSLAICFASFSPSVDACTCDCGSFNTVCAIMENVEGTFIFSGVVTAAVGFEWEVKILENLNNQSTDDTVKVITENVCQELLVNKDQEEAEVGDTIIVTASFVNLEFGTNRQLYTQNSCSSTALTFENDSIKGAINGNTSAMSRADFKNYLLSDLSQDIFCTSCNCNCFFSFAIGFPPINTFCGTLNHYSTSNINILAASVKILSQQDHGFTASIETLVLGDENDLLITVWGKIGGECRYRTAELEVGKEYVLLAEKMQIDDFVSDLEKPGDYLLSGCGVHLLPIEDGQVSGSITGAIDQMDLDLLIDLILTNFEGIDHCFGLQESIKEEKAPAENIRLFPNPTSGLLHIDWLGTEWSSAEILLYDASGNIIHSGPIDFSNTASIDLNAYTQNLGLFILEIKTDKFSFVDKILKL